MSNSDSDEVPSNQEMFDRAVRGLASQGWQKSESDDRHHGTLCVYRKEMPDGSVRHCAWGWVDPEGTAHNPDGSVETLYANGTGLAASHSGMNLMFARNLQRSHDNSSDAGSMVLAFRALAERYGLSTEVMDGLVSK